VLESKYFPYYINALIPQNRFVQDAIAQAVGLKPEDDADLYSITEHLEEVDINQYALMVIVQYRDRFSTYIKKPLA
jgi:hypothetical protein